MPTQQKLP